MLLRKSILIFILFITGVQFLEAQNHYGMPLVDNYYPVEYKGYSQNWSICSNSQGLMFFANGDGVLIYDGRVWQKILLPNNSTPSVLYCDENDVIWIGAQSEIGVLIPDPVLGYRYHSLTNLIPEKYRKFGFILQILESGDGVYFRANSHLFRFYKGKIIVRVIPRQSFLFTYKKIAFFFNHDNGFKIISGNKFLNVNSQFNELMIIRAVLPYSKDSLILLDPLKGLFFAEINVKDPLKASINISPVYSQINDYIIRNDAYSAIALQNGNYAFSTTRDGTIVSDRDFNVLFTLNKNSGVMNETHNALYEDDQNNLWIALDHGLSKVNLSSPLTYYNTTSGIDGSVLDIQRFASRLFVATWQGVYYETKNEYGHEDTPFSIIKGIRTIAWMFDEINIGSQKFLLTATSDAIYLIDSLLNVRKLVDGNFTFITIDEENHRIFAGSPSGAELIYLNGLRAEESIPIPQIEGRITSMVLSQDNHLVIGTALNGVYIVHATDIAQNQNVSFELYHLLPGTDLSKSDFYNVYHCNKYVLIISKTGIYKIVRSKNEYSAEIYDPSFARFFQNYQFINIIKQDSKGNLWFQVNSKQSGEKNLIYARKNGNTFAFLSKAYRTFPNLEFYTIYPEPDSVVWFGSDDGVFRYHQSQDNFKERRESFPTLIKAVTIGDSLIYSGMFSMKILKKILHNKSKIPQLSMSGQSIRFDFSASYYSNEEQVRFTYLLEGFDDNWSTLSWENYKEYTSLPSGEYTFMVKAVNPYGVIGDIAYFHFKVPAPWYFRWWAWIIYGVSAILLLFGIISFSNRRLLKAKARLESIIHQRTQEINNQKKAIEGEKEKADALLLNILPVRIADELKSKGLCQTEFYQSTSVLFTDFSNFTVISEQLDPEDLVSKLDLFFARFDEICSRHKMEKIKTIGDSHMSVGGIPVRNRTHPIDAVLAAVEMQEFIRFMHKKGDDNKVWQLRIGINSGELTAGVVGKKKFAFDVWGDTVNTASRFQDAGECGKINVSVSTAHAVEKFFNLEARGKKPIKHKGEVEMFYVTSIKKELSIDGMGEKPNENFWRKYNELVDIKFLNF